MTQALTRLTVGHLMSRRIFAVRADDDLATVRNLMFDHHVRHIPVIDDEESLVGLISHRDLLRNHLVEQTQVPAFVEDAVLEMVRAAEVMVTDPEVVAPETDVREAARTMFDNKYGCLPVVEGGRLVGILTEADFVRLLADGE